MGKPLLRAVAVVLVASVLLGGCLPFSEPTPLAVGPNGETATPTLNATQLAIALMLTATRAAPTATQTPVVTLTSTPSPTTTPPPLGSAERPVRLGTRMAVEGAGLTVLSMQTLTEVNTRKAAEGMAFLDVETIVENAPDSAAGAAPSGVSAAPLDYTPLYFRLLDAQDNAYQPVGAGVQPAIQSGTLRPGEWVRGHVTFEIPATAGTLRLRYTPVVAAGYAIAMWVDLSLPPVQAELPTTPPIIELGDAAKALPMTGQRDEAGGIALTIAQVDVSQRIGPTKASAGSLLVALNVTIENVSRARSPFNPQYFSVKDDKGYEYQATLIPLESLLQAGSLGQGEKVSGQVVFEVPEGTPRLVVEYQPQVLVDQYPVIRFLIDVPR